jgi:hypothetical protein
MKFLSDWFHPWELIRGYKDPIFKISSLECLLAMPQAPRFPLSYNDSL